MGLFVVDPEDGFVASALLNHGAYSNEELTFDLSLISPSTRALVVGTHIGAIAIPLAAKVSSLTAIEANPQTFELLQANVRLSGAQNITIHNRVVGDEDGREIEFLLNRDNSGGSKIKPKSDIDPTSGYFYDNPELIKARTVRLDTLLAGQQFDFIVMDIEGSEVLALRGMLEILRTAQTLAVEFRPHHMMDVAGSDLDAFLASVLPHFAWLFIPGVGVIPNEEIASRLWPMYRAGTCYDAIYFFKKLPDVALN